MTIRHPPAPCPCRKRSEEEDDGKVGEKKKSLHGRARVLGLVLLHSNFAFMVQPTIQLPQSHSILPVRASVLPCSLLQARRLELHSQNRALACFGACFFSILFLLKGFLVPYLGHNGS